MTSVYELVFKEGHTKEDVEVILKDSIFTYGGWRDNKKGESCLRVISHDLFVKPDYFNQFSFIEQVDIGTL